MGDAAAAGEDKPSAIDIDGSWEKLPVDPNAPMEPEPAEPATDDSMVPFIPTTAGEDDWDAFVK